MVYNDRCGQKLENKPLLRLSMAMTFSKHGLRAQQFRRNTAQIRQPTIAKQFASERPFLGEP
jgi:hypothetical protein